MAEGARRVDAGGAATLNGGDVASIQGLLEDPGVSEWVRGAAVNSLLEMVFSDQLGREEVIAYLAELLSGKLGREHSNVWDCLVCVAADLHATERRPHIRRAYEEGWWRAGRGWTAGL